MSSESSSCYNRDSSSNPRSPADNSSNTDQSSCLDPQEQIEIVEWLFALSCQFVAQVAQPGQEGSLPLVHFVGVLGVHSYSLVYRTAYAFTSTISGLIWICRLLMLEYSLPLREYLDVCWPGRDSYEDQLARLHFVRRKFLCRGGFHPTAYLIEALAYGRRIARKEGCRSNISWSSDKEVLTLYNQRITMSAFRQMIWSSIQDCQGGLTKAMLDWVPATTDLLAIRDNMTENQPGWSFVKDPENHLQHSFRHLQRRAFAPEHLAAKGRWSLPRCQAYLSRVEELKKQLLVYIHLTRGLPGRGTEVTTIKWCNTRQTMRNIFVCHGQLMVVIEYNKNRASTNNSFYVARILPSLVSQILFQYLAYVRPFCDALVH